MPLLEIRDLTLEFGHGPSCARALDRVSLEIRSGETVCLVGESGSGKSLTALSIGRLVPEPPARYTSGSIRIEGRNVFEMDGGELQRIRGGVISYVFQEPAASLNPVFRVGGQIMESLRLHRPQEATAEEVVRLLKLVGIPAPEVRARDYPHQLSGGMQQRIMIAMAIASRPKLLIADEPTTALDVTIQAEILDLLRDLQRDLGMSILLITHNLGLVRDMADRVAVLYAGQIVEEAPATVLLAHPRHPYTRALLASVPQLGRKVARLSAIPGAVPHAGAYPSGCRFHPRCRHARRDCREKAVPLEEEESHFVRCPYWNAPAPSVGEALNESFA